MPRGKLTAPVSVLTMIESEQHEALRLIAFNERTLRGRTGARGDR